MFELRYLFIFGICVIAAVIVFVKKARAKAVIENAKNGTLDTAIALAIKYLANCITSSGKFIYTKNSDPHKIYSPVQYGSMRHAGTLYSMYLYEKYSSDISYKDKRIFASNYLVDNYIQKIGDDKYVLITKPEEENTGEPIARVGGAGLGLAALANLYPEGNVEYEILEGLGNFILFMQKPNGNYFHRYIPSSELRDKTFEAIYYPGEACLGLLYLYDVDPKEKWLNSVRRWMLYVADYRGKWDDDDLPFDHWGFLAAKKFFDNPDNNLDLDETRLIKNYYSRMARNMVQIQITDPADKLVGSFMDKSGLCGIGTIIEGLVAAYDITDDEKLKIDLMRALHLGTEFLSRYQIKTGPLQGGIPASAYWNHPNAALGMKAVRIDNVQHVLSGWVAYKSLFQ